MPYLLSLLWCAGFDYMEAATLLGMHPSVVKLEFIMLDYTLQVTVG